MRQSRLSSPSRTVTWIPSAYTYAIFSVIARFRHSPYSRSHDFFSATIADGDSPAVVSSPRSPTSADWKSPVDRPFKYRIGSRFSTFADFRR